MAKKPPPVDLGRFMALPPPGKEREEAFLRMMQAMQGAPKPDVQAAQRMFAQQALGQDAAYQPKTFGDRERERQRKLDQDNAWFEKLKAEEQRQRFADAVAREYEREQIRSQLGVYAGSQQGFSGGSQGLGSLAGMAGGLQQGLSGMGFGGGEYNGIEYFPARQLYPVQAPAREIRIPMEYPPAENYAQYRPKPAEFLPNMLDDAYNALEADSRETLNLRVPEAALMALRDTWLEKMSRGDVDGMSRIDIVAAIRKDLEILVKAAGPVSSAGGGLDLDEPAAKEPLPLPKIVLDIEPEGD